MQDLGNGQTTWLQRTGEDTEALFGVALPLGPIRYTFHVKLDNEEDLRKRIAEAPNIAEPERQRRERPAVPPRPSEEATVGSVAAENMQPQRNAGAIQLLRQWMEEDAAMSAEQQEAAEVEWERIKSGLEADRLSDRPLYS